MNRTRLNRTNRTTIPAAGAALLLGVASLAACSITFHGNVAQW